MTDRSRILLINPALPYPANQGTRIATLGLIRALQRDFDVTVLARIVSTDELGQVTELEGLCSRVVTVMTPDQRSTFHRLFFRVYYHLVSSLTRRSLKSLYECPGALLRAARRLSAEHFDLVVIGDWQLGRMLDLFPQERVVLLTHDIDLLINRQISLLERNLVSKIQAVRRWLLEQKEELAAYRAARHIWTLTDRDKTAVETISQNDASVAVLPVGVDIDFLAPSGMQRNEGEVLFLGDLEAPYNLDALEYFVRKIYPHMSDFEGLSITVVGGDLPHEVEFFGLQPEVEVVGQVADVRPYLHRAACMVIPLRFGGGLRRRVLEAMAAGLPVVCSDVAMSGLPFEPGSEYLLADTPEEFAHQVKQLLAEPARAMQITEVARGRVETLYSIGPQEQRARELARRLIESAK